MKEIRVYKVIDKEDIFFSFFGEEDPFAFSADAIHKVFDENPEETEFKFHINCDGGVVSEGLRIYDVLRTSGKTLHCNIEGGCHSMAIILLLAAPKENRTANPNSRALIHEVRGGSWDFLKADELRTVADEIEREQNAILDIYADRTGYDRAELEILMKEEKMRTAQELIQYGFISKINTYSTNLKPKNQMSKPTKTVQELLNQAKELGKKLLNLTEGETVNFEFKDAEGVVLFTTEKEDDSIAVGDAASPDGTFELPDGRKVVIADGVITEINEPESTNSEEVKTLQNTVSQLTDALKEANNMITELRNHVQSNFVATPRTRVPGKQNEKTVQSVEELRNEAKANRLKMKGVK